MLQSPQNAISTAKFQQKVLNIDTNTSQFDTTSALIQSMYQQIDDLIDAIKMKVPKSIKSARNYDEYQMNATQINMLKADEESTNLQQYYLAIESEEISNALYSKPNDMHLQIAQLKKANQIIQQQIVQSKQALFITDSGLKEVEGKIYTLQEKQQNFASLLIKLKEKQQIGDSVSKLLDQLGQQQWFRLRQLFDVDMIKTGLALGNLIKLQQILIKEAENLIQVGKHQQVLEEKNQLLIEVQFSTPILNLILSFDQILLNIVHQPKDQLISKQGILVQVVKCINILHQNFCWVVHNLSKHSYTQHQLEDNQKELIQLSNQQKQIQQSKTQSMIEIDKLKKQQKETLLQLSNLQSNQDRQIENEVQNLLYMYLRDKEGLMRDIKFKYGKQYHDHMIIDVKQEFKKICQTQQFEQTKKIEDAYLRMEEIQNQIIKNKDKIIQIHKQIKEYKFKQDQEFKSDEDQIIDKKEFLLQLQNLKIILLQLENKIQKKTQLNSEQLLNDLQIEINKLSSFIEDNFVPIKQRSDSIDYIKKPKLIEHGRSQSQIPLASTIASDVQIQSPKEPQIIVQNGQDMFDSSDDPIQIVKKPFSEWNSYQLSFNQNQLKSISGISQQEQSFITQKDSSLHGSILEAIQSNRNKKTAELFLIVYLQLNEIKKIYDPIKNDDPTKFGFKLVRIDNQLNIYSSDENENMNSFQKFERKLDVKQLILDEYSQNALKFRMIYEPQMRGICQDSLALKHLNMKYLPFKLQGEQKIINGLCLNEQDLIKLQLLFKQ